MLVRAMRQTLGGPMFGVVGIVHYVAFSDVLAGVTGPVVGPFANGFRVHQDSLIGLERGDVPKEIAKFNKKGPGWQLSPTLSASNYFATLRTDMSGLPDLETYRTYCYPRMTFFVEIA